MIDGLRDAFEPHTLDVEQLNLFEEDSPRRGDASGDDHGTQTPRVHQLTELPGESFEDIFGGAA